MSSVSSCKSAQTPNTIIIITPNVFKNDVVKEASAFSSLNLLCPRYEASVTTKKTAARDNIPNT